jgi:hypothetical protein
MLTRDPDRLEIAHGLPGRLRLRWRGSEAPPPGLLTRLERARDVEEVAYRPSSRSLVLRHGSRFDLADLRSIAGELGIEVRESPPPAPAVPRGRRSRRGATKQELLVADLEALLLLVLMALWVRDMIVARTIRLATLLLMTLTGLHLYEFWRRRAASRREMEERLMEVGVDEAAMLETIAPNG